MKNWKFHTYMAIVMVMLAGNAFIHTLGPCEFKDESNCYWNANIQGNGEGTSFVDVAGYRLYIGG